MRRLTRAKLHVGRSLRTTPLVSIMACATGLAQSPESDAPAGMPAAGEPADGYLVPDAPSDVLTSANVEHPRFSIKAGMAMLLDYTWFDQDDASIAQVGEQNDTGEVRDLRITARGDLRLIEPWRYQVTAQYKGFDREPTDTDDWTFTDVNLARDFAFGTLTFGKIKQTFSYEMVGDAANLPQSERLLTPFFKSRDTRHPGERHAARRSRELGARFVRPGRPAGQRAFHGPADLGG